MEPDSVWFLKLATKLCLLSRHRCRTNLSAASQNLEPVCLEVAGPRDVKAPSEAWYSRALTPYLKDKLGVPDGWAWSHVEGSLGISPGTSSSGFQLVSSSPPAIVRVFAAGRVAPLRTNEDLPDELHEAIDAIAWATSRRLYGRSAEQCLDSHTCR